MDETKEHQSDIHEEENVTTEKKSNMFNRIGAKLGLDVGTILIMMKGALPPTIVLAAIESKAFAEEYTTLGYLAAVMSLLSLAILPRAKFFQSMLISIVFTCVGAAVALLQIQCVVSARNSTTPKAPATQPGPSGGKEAVQYNSSASVVACIWLCVTVYISNVLKASLPQLTLPVVQYSIFTIIASTSAPAFPNMTIGMKFVERLLKTFLTGFGIATGVSLLIIPVTSRKIVSKQMVGLLEAMKKGLGVQGSYMQSVSRSHSLRAETNEQDLKANEKSTKETHKKSKAKPTGIAGHAEAVAANMRELTGLFAKLQMEISFAKKEIAFGKLDPEDYTTIHNHFANILQPLVGMSTFIDIMQSILKHEDIKHGYIDSDETVKAIKRLEADEWEEIFVMSHDSFLQLREALINGLSHVGYILEFAQKPKSAKKDVEETADADPTPGDSRFTKFLEQKINMFHLHRQGAVQRWCERKGIDVPDRFWDDSDAEFSWKDQKNFNEDIRRKQNHQQLYLILYVEYLLFGTSKAILKMVQFADSKVEDGTMKKNRFIFPGWRQLRKLVENSVRHVDSEQTLADGRDGGVTIRVGDSFNQQKDPEHLPPRNGYEKVTNKLRSIPKFFASEQSAYGFRTAVATLSLGILAYLRQTHVFFQAQRGVWAMIMTALSMGANSGVGMFGFVTRIFGTAVAGVAAIAIWYMGDQKPAAVIPLFFLFEVIGMGFLMKMPSLMIVSVISMVTTILVVGYELQEMQLGVQVVESSGQPYYKVYLLAPYRLLTVCAGIGVAFFWTYFPYPVTAHSTLRKDLGSTLYLLGNYYSCVHTTVASKLHLGSEVNKLKSDSGPAPMVRLDKARRKVFSKLVIMLDRLRDESNMTKFELRIGGKFPKSIYDELISSMQRLMLYTTLMAYSANAFSSEADSESESTESAWLRDFRRFTADLNITSHEMTSTLCLASASVLNSQPLPPYLRLPRPFSLADRMESVDPEILSIKHVSEPCYAAFAVLEVASSLVTEQMAQIIEGIRELVGEVDFSFHVISTTDDPLARQGSAGWKEGEDSDNTLVEGLKGKKE